MEGGCERDFKWDEIFDARLLYLETDVIDAATAIGMLRTRMRRRGKDVNVELDVSSQRWCQPA